MKAKASKGGELIRIARVRGPVLVKMMFITALVKMMVITARVEPKRK